MASLRILATAVIVVALAATVDAFAPLNSGQQRSTFLCSTMDKKDKEQKELLPPQVVTPKRSAGIKIEPIAPLGASTRFGNANPLKEFPTYEMKERFRKIREPRKQFTKVPTKIDPPSDIVVPPKSCPPLLFGIGEFFDTESLVQTVRENADVGKPIESTRSLADKIPLDEKSFLSCGSASCTQGGWPSKIPASNKTQLFYLLSGFGCLTDMDGARHYFGPGDTVVVPRNWAGRVDVAEDLHKVSNDLDETKLIASIFFFLVSRVLVFWLRRTISYPSCLLVVYIIIDLVCTGLRNNHRRERNSGRRCRGRPYGSSQCDSLPRIGPMVLQGHQRRRRKRRRCPQIRKNIYNSPRLWHGIQLHHGLFARHIHFRGPQVSRFATKSQRLLSFVGRHHGSETSWWSERVFL